MRIKYRIIIPGQSHFDCQPLRATISSAACAERWNTAMHEADSKRRDKAITCRRCPIGARHFNEHCGDVVERPADTGAPRAAVCIRCGRPAARMIGNEVCVSCSNREYEYRKGRNARGNAPVTYIPPRPWRVGVIEADGRQAWRSFEGQSIAEAQARAVRAGFRLHDRHPGAITWNATAERFEYRDSSDRILLEIEVDGALEFFPVRDLRPGEQPAPVRMPAFFANTDEAAALLAGDESLSIDWQQVDLACGRCAAGVLHARKRHTGIDCRCSATCS